MKILLWIPIAFLLSACSALTPMLNEQTGTTKAQRCVDYQGFLAAATALQVTNPTPDRAERIKYYRVFIETNCLNVVP